MPARQNFGIADSLVVCVFCQGSAARHQPLCPGGEIRFLYNGVLNYGTNEMLIREGRLRDADQGKLEQSRGTSSYSAWYDSDSDSDSDSDFDFDSDPDRDYDFPAESCCGFMYSMG